MFFYHVNLEFINDAVKKMILTVLPAQTLTVESPTELNDICLMQFIRKATSNILYQLNKTSSLDLVVNDAQFVWDSYLSRQWNPNGHLIQPVLKFTGFNLVEKASDWNIKANPIEVMECIYFTSTAALGQLPESDDQIWFDCDLCNVMTKESECDYDNEVRASGVITFNRTSKDLTITLTDEFKTCKGLFDLPDTKAYFLTLVDWIFSQPDFRSLNISSGEIDARMKRTLNISSDEIDAYLKTEPQLQ
ncbi:hypothetical protein OFK41_07860 [Acinetobacter baumannii]|uniref:hypothetical protein n=1 Tax=Acinetobacter baumannii TaxID=470 RepID=UPI0022574FD3|nr:hypothetical protein [Acinetobacter baumannii]MCX3034122.1 hypothetical protein [Acinetobacter baumannii]